MKSKIGLLVIVAAFTSLKAIAQKPVTTEWIAPKEANAKKNPLAADAKAAAEGKKTYVQMCAVCHGEKGDGNGPAGISMKPKPGNFTGVKVQAQTDGAIFHKMSEGKGGMAPYKNILSEKQRWQLVKYIRTFKKK